MSIYIEHDECMKKTKIIGDFAISFFLRQRWATSISGRISILIAAIKLVPSTFCKRFNYKRSLSILEYSETCISIQINYLWINIFLGPRCKLQHLYLYFKQNQICSTIIRNAVLRQSYLKLSIRRHIKSCRRIQQSNKVF